MLLAINSAKLGDDVFGEDPTVDHLERTAAQIFGKEKGLFLPSGTMANLCALTAHGACHDAPEAIVGSGSHINLYEGEGGGRTRLLQLAEASSPSSADFGALDLDDVADALRADDPHYPSSSAVVVENTHNVLGGVPVGTEYMSRLRHMVDAVCAAKGIGRVPIHVDGARIFHVRPRLAPQASFF